MGKNIQRENTCLKIVLFGPECTGKTTLAKLLANHYKSQWVPEFARFYLDRLDRDYQEADLLEIAKAQLAWEEDRATSAEKYLFCDTNLIVLKIWSDEKYGKTDSWILDQIAHRKYHFYLLSDIDIPWYKNKKRSSYMTTFF